MIKVQLNSSVVVRISSTGASFYWYEDKDNIELPFLTIPSHQISRINELIKGLQNLPKTSIREDNSQCIQNH